MKSRVTVEIDFDNKNQPVIRISPWSSEDVRDAIVKNLVEQLAQSDSTSVRFTNQLVRPDGTAYQDVILTPTYGQDLKFTNYETTELAQEAISDGQSIRPFWNYLSKTFDGIKGREFEFDQITFNEREVFYEHLIGVLKMMITSVRNEKPTQHA